MLSTFGMLLPALLAATAPQIPFTPEHLLLDPGPSLRSRLSALPANVPEAGVRFVVKCVALKVDGRASDCQLPDGEPILADIARQRASYYIFKVDDVIAAGIKPKKGMFLWSKGFEVDVVEWIRPGDRKEASFGQQERTANDLLRFRERPDGAVIGGLYPWAGITTVRFNNRTDSTGYRVAAVGFAPVLG